MTHECDDWLEHTPAMARSAASSRAKNLQRVFFGIISVGAVAVVVSMALDTAQSKHASILLHNLNTLPSGGIDGGKKGGGLIALAAFGKRVVKFAAGVKEATPHGAHLTHAATVRAASMARLAALATKLAAGEGNITDAEGGNGTKTEADAPVAAELGASPTEGESTGAPAAAKDTAGPHMWDVAKPGWDKGSGASGWDAGDWAVWLVTGPLFTAGSTVFVWYEYGPMYGMGVLMFLVAVDTFALCGDNTFALYYNV
ncbi:hypothetical protein T484DRAFT_1937606 [Baffinella frigidus]|nr:hypothetical protein T484DRAFT_1937606 [Cryptophyta sp. CCMP2293]